MTFSQSEFSPFRSNPMLRSGSELIDVAAPLLDDDKQLRVTMDIQLGEDYSMVDIDTAATVQRLRDEGLSRQDIAELTVDISAEVIKEYGGTLNGYYVGTAEPVITLYPNGVLDLYREEAMELLGSLPPDKVASLNNPEDKLSNQLTSTLYHEIRHAKQHVVEGNLLSRNNKHDRRRNIRKFLGLAAGILLSVGQFISQEVTFESKAMTIGSGALGVGGIFATLIALESNGPNREHKHYLANPNEVDARSTEQEVHEPLVRIIPKTDTVRWTVPEPDPTLIARREFLQAIIKDSYGPTIRPQV